MFFLKQEEKQSVKKPSLVSRMKRVVAALVELESLQAVS